MATISEASLDVAVLRPVTPERAATVSRLPRRMPALLGAIPVLADGVAIAAGYLIAGLPNPWLASVIVLLCLWIAGTYRRRLTLSGLDVVPVVAVAAGAGAVLTTFANHENVGVGDLLVPVAVASAGVITARFAACFAAQRLRQSASLRSRVVVVGSDEVGIALTQKMIADPQYGLEPVLILDDESVGGMSLVDRVPVHPASAATEIMLKANRVDTAVIAFHHLDDPQLESLLADLDRMGCDVFVVPRMWDSCPVVGGWDRLGAVPIMRIRHPMHRNRMRFLKSACERCVAGAALLMLAPLLAAVGIALKVLHPKEPVLFRQNRVGQHGREFELLKFRSMTPANELESQTSWTIIGDSRIDAFGRFLRASSIDELPQLWNIVRGEMALIGPRPERPHFVEQFGATIPGYHARHRVPVGLTGWAAVNGLSGDTSISERVRYDNFYITNWSLWFDVKITLRTAWTLVMRFRQGRSEERASRVAVRNPRRERVRTVVHLRGLSPRRRPETESLCRAR